MLPHLLDPLMAIVTGLWLLGLGLMALADQLAMREAERHFEALIETDTRAERRGAKAVHDTLRNGLVRS